jgi:hypothetical protein
MRSQAASVERYLQVLPTDRQQALRAVRSVIVDRLLCRPRRGVEEGMQYGRHRCLSSGMKLDMGKSCVRFRRLADVPIEVVGEAISRTSVDDVIGAYEQNRGQR